MAWHSLPDFVNRDEIGVGSSVPLSSFGWAEGDFVGIERGFLFLIGFKGLRFWVSGRFGLLDLGVYSLDL